MTAFCGPCEGELQRMEGRNAVTRRYTTQLFLLFLRDRVFKVDGTSIRRCGRADGLVVVFGFLLPIASKIIKNRPDCFSSDGFVFPQGEALNSLERAVA